MTNDEMSKVISLMDIYTRVCMSLGIKLYNIETTTDGKVIKDLVEEIIKTDEKRIGIAKEIYKIMEES